MHLDLIESLTIAGTPGGANDDRVGLAGSHGWVIDGCTDLGDPGLLGTRGGAAWIAGEADRAFAGGEGDLGHICRHVFDTVARRYAECRTREAEPWELPSAAFLAVAVRDATLECAWLGDCPAVLIRDGAVTRIGPQPEGRDAELALARSLAHHGLGQVRRAAPVLERLRAQRANPERRVLGVNPAGAAHLLRERRPCGAGDKLLLMSDGFAALLDQYALIGAAALPELLRTEGLAGLARRLRMAEAGDAECTRWPRFKRGDDASALWLRIAG